MEREKRLSLSLSLSVTKVTGRVSQNNVGGQRSAGTEGNRAKVRKTKG